MKLIYKDKKTEKICTSLLDAKKFFDGNKQLAESLLIRINALISAQTIHDIIIQPQFRFHKLLNFGKDKNLKGYFAIDVKSSKEKWRIIIQPLDDNEKAFNPCNIDVISKNVKIIEIKEISNHYG